MSKKDIDDRFESMDFADLTAEEKIRKYFSLYAGYEKMMDGEKIYEWYVENETINPVGMFKKEILKKVLLGVNNRTELEYIISRIQYHKIGNYYQMNDGYFLEKLINKECLIDEQGNFIDGNYLDFEFFEDEKITDESTVNALPNYLTKETLGILSEQFKQIFGDFNAKYPNVIFNRGNTAIRVFNDILSIEIDLDFSQLKRFYKIQPDGTLEEIEIRTR